MILFYSNTYFTYQWYFDSHTLIYINIIAFDNIKLVCVYFKLAQAPCSNKNDSRASWLKK